MGRRIFKASTRDKTNNLMSVVSDLITFNQLKNQGPNVLAKTNHSVLLERKLHSTTYEHTPSVAKYKITHSREESLFLNIRSLSNLTQVFPK